MLLQGVWGHLNNLDTSQLPGHNTRSHCHRPPAGHSPIHAQPQAVTLDRNRQDSCSQQWDRGVKMQHSTPPQHQHSMGETHRHTALHWMPSSQNPALTQSGEAQFSLDKAPCSAPPQGQHTLHRKVRGSAHMLCQLQQWLLYTLEGRSRQGGCLALQGCLSDH